MSSSVKILCIALLAAAAGAVIAPAFVSAQSSEQGQYKIGVVDRKQVFDNYEKQKEEFAKLESNMKEMQKEIDSLSEKIEEARQKHAAAKDTMKPEDRERLEQQINSDVLRYQTEFKRLQAEIDAQTHRLLKRLKADIDEVVHQIGVEQNYHLILEGDSQSPSGVLFFATGIDITSEVITRLNKKASPR